ncbi:hypothetical protein ACLI4Q_20085 [Natrialbaceae archaeon A-CW1-1]
MTVAAVLWMEPIPRPTHVDPLDEAESVRVPPTNTCVEVAANVDLEVLHDGSLGVWNRIISRPDGHHSVNILIVDPQRRRGISSDSKELVGIEVDIVRFDEPRPRWDDVHMVSVARAERLVVVVDRLPEVVLIWFNPQVTFHVDDMRVRTFSIEVDPNVIVVLELSCGQR